VHFVGLFFVFFVALIVMPGKAYGEMESPAFFQIKITAQLHYMNICPRQKSLWLRPVHWTARACVCLFICYEFAYYFRRCL